MTEEMDLQTYLDNYQQTAVKKPARKNGRRRKRQENVVQAGIIDYLKMSPYIAWVRRHNSGKVKTEWGTWVELGETGDADVFAMFSDAAGPAFAGRFLAVEVKDGDNEPTEAQWAFIHMVNGNGGVAFPAWSVDEVIDELANRGILT